MARIRTIKPEFPQSESMGRVSRDARLLFVMLWPICDDHGRARAASRMLASLLFPYDDDAPQLIEGWLTELEREGCISRYDDGDSKYLVVHNWLKHQKIDKPSKPQFPEPPRVLANPRERSSEEGKGREGKGKDLGSLRSPSSKTGEPVKDASAPADLQSRKAERLRQVTLDAVETFNAVLGKPNGLLPAIRIAVGRKVREREVSRVLQLARQICTEVYGTSVISRQFWVDYWAQVDQDDFRSGRMPPGRGHENWVPCFEYLTRERTMLEVFDRAASEQPEAGGADQGSAAA